jgi:NAD(P)H dehydrogenase (quinone)
MLVVTGATGQLGRLVVEGLLEKVPADQIVAAVRSPEKAADLAERGVQVRRADYDDPASLEAAVKDASRVLLVSGNEMGQRIAQHSAVIEAVRQARVDLLVYTSAPRADTSPLVLAPEHKATEEIIQATGLPFTFLRNGWYTENFTNTIKQAAQTGSFVGSAGDGRVASAARADYAEAAIAVLTGDGHENRTYELSGDVAWTYADLAAAIAEVAGRPVEYREVTPDEHRKALTEAGLPAQIVDMLVTLDANTADGLLADTSGELAALIGHPTIPLATTIATILANN